MKILVGALAILMLATGFMGWRLKVAWEDVATARGDALQAQQVAGEQRQQAELLNQRLVVLDGTLKDLATGTKANGDQLELTIDAIEQIKPTGGVPHDPSIACLDLRVPGQLDERLR
jgi:hypothetical protein